MWSLKHFVSDQLKCRLWALRMPLWSFLFSSSYNLIALNIERYISIIAPMYHKTKVSSGNGDFLGEIGKSNGNFYERKLFNGALIHGFNHYWVNYLRIVFLGETQSRIHLVGVRLACGSCGKILPSLVSQWSHRWHLLRLYVFPFVGSMSCM